MLAHILPECSVGYKILATLGCLLAVSVCGFKWRKGRLIHRRMEQERKRREDTIRHMQEAVRKFHQQNPGVESQKIRDLTLVELAEKLKDGSISPESALYSYVEKALDVHSDLNCLTSFLSDCEDQLRKLRNREEGGLLYGVPVSIKECLDYQGEPSTSGMVQYLDVLEEEDSVIVKVLKKQGAIVFAKTNVPQSLISIECSNPIYGRTMNPHNKAKSTAGSSGGEGALIAAGGSILGIGSDLGGSIRLPSSSCGIAGLKPTPKRLSISGHRNTIEGMTTVPVAFGPMARDVDSLALGMRALCCDEMFRLDPYVTPVHFNDEMFSSKKPLRIGYYEEDGFFQPSPGMRRMVLETKKLLEEAGHTLIHFKPPRVEQAFHFFLKGCFGDGGKTLVSQFDDNKVDPNLRELILLFNVPVVVKKMISYILWPIFPRMSKVLYEEACRSSVYDFWAYQAALEKYQAEFVSEWKKLDLDVVVCPVSGPAFTYGYPARLIATVSYTMLYNLLQFPAGVVPVGSVTAEDEEALKHYTGYDNDLWDKLFKKGLADGVGLPLAVQCAALPYHDELCLRVMKEIETLSKQKLKK
ncbi:vitamin D3 hydroxylase-associated protein-like [Hyperolius riggenbachi]|uniref:vitamin D3 hydroxylase-associated protein-like n=1 Tax=Hyperolius riggenbachi TaxID=752182 RepID=UPI0035A29FA5